jgi:hypothetical protein
MIKLWPDKAPSAPRQSPQAEMPTNIVFPSGRQALTEAIRQFGLSRENRVALPEWSSLCVINAVGKVVTPIPMAEVVKYNIQVDAVLLYEQWGWPLPYELRSSIAERFKNDVIILDRVDSADIENQNRIKFYPQNNQIELISLSKILGLKGGGLAKIDGNYLEFENKSLDNCLSEHLWRDVSDNMVEEKLLHIHKNDIESLHEDLRDWLGNNDLSKAIKEEALKRRENLRCVMDKSLSSDWPRWMFDAFEKGASPGIVPLFRNADKKKLEDKQKVIKAHFDIEGVIYHFNWSGNPLEPSYGLCLAFPIHGEVAEMELLVEELVKLQ